MPPLSKETFDDIWHRTSRALLGRHRVTLVRWARSQRDLRRLARADISVVSFAKSGRTWLRVMLSRLFQIKYGLPDRVIIERDNLHRLNPAIPIFHFTQGSYIQDVRPIVGEASPYQRKKLLFLARHPADTAASYYFHNKNRIKPLMKDVKRLPEHIDETSIFEFVTNPSWGLPGIVDYLNGWAAALTHHPRHLLVRYEDLRADPKPQLRRIADFMGESFDDAAYDEAIEFASFERLQQMERENFFGNRRLQPRDETNPESFKVRRGKVGGYRDYFTAEEIAWIEGEVRRLDPMFGYTPEAAAGRAPDKARVTAGG